MRRALIVGITNYHFISAHPAGCLNDADDMDAFLGGAGFAQRVVLKDADATAQRIESVLATLVAELANGDQLVFFFSGHGCPVGTDTGTQEAILPVDFDFEVPGRNVLTASRLAAIFGLMAAGARATIIADCCFSGALTPTYVQFFLNAPGNALFASDVGSDGGLDIRSPQLPESFAVQLALTANAPVLTIAAAAAQPRVKGLVLVAACEDGAVANPLNGGGSNGVLTWYLLHELQTSGGLKRSVFATVAAVKQAIHDGGYLQVPQLHGDHLCFNDPLLRSS